MKRQILSVAILAAMASPAYAGDIIAINPDGVAGGDPTILNVGSVGWNNSNAIAIDAIDPNTGTIRPVGTVFQTYAHAQLANFTDSDGNVVTPPGIGGGTYEWTFVAGFQEEVVGFTANPDNNPATLDATASFQVAAGGDNFFRIYYDAPRDSNNLTGKGFNDGLLILEGTILPYDATTGLGAGSFDVTGIELDPATGAPLAALDQFGDNNYPALFTVTGNGSTDVVIAVSFADPNFFLPGLDLLTLNFDSFQNVPFQEQNPSSCFWDGGAYIIGAGTVNPANPNDCEGASSFGALNGVSGPNVIFETRSSNDFTVEVPEPGSLLLLGLGLAGLGGTLRRRSVA